MKKLVIILLGTLMSGSSYAFFDSCTSDKEFDDRKNERTLEKDDRNRERMFILNLSQMFNKTIQENQPLSQQELDFFKAKYELEFKEKEFNLKREKMKFCIQQCGGDFTCIPKCYE